MGRTSEVVVRGNYVDFTASFFDPDGAPTDPDSATLYVFYILGGAAALDTVPMTATADPSVWTATWKTNGIDPNSVSWSVLGHAGSVSIAADGGIDVSANNANQVGVHS